MFRVFHYVNEVYRTKSFSIAAQNLFISQPALSLTIKKFEKEIGIQIFDRSSTPIQLTDAGKMYMQGLQKILEIEGQLNNFLDDYNDINVGKLTIGAPHFFSSFLLPPIIAKFHTKYPHIEIQLIETDFLSLQELTMDGVIDVLIESSEFDNEKYIIHPLFTEYVLLAVPASYNINKKLSNISLDRSTIISNQHRTISDTRIPLKEFSDLPFVLLQKGHDMHRRSMQLFKQYDINPKVFMSLNQLMTVYNLVNQQLGVSLVSDTIVKFDNNCQNVMFYKLDEELSMRIVNIAHKRNRYISKPMMKFIEMMQLSCSQMNLIP